MTCTQALQISSLRGSLIRPNGPDSLNKYSVQLRLRANLDKDDLRLHTAQPSREGYLVIFYKNTNFYAMHDLFKIEISFWITSRLLCRVDNIEKRCSFNLFKAFQPPPVPSTSKFSLTPTVSVENTLLTLFGFTTNRVLVRADEKNWHKNKCLFFKVWFGQTFIVRYVGVWCVDHKIDSEIRIYLIQIKSIDQKSIIRYDTKVAKEPMKDGIKVTRNLNSIRRCL